MNMVLEMAAAACAVARMVCHCGPPPSAFSGTTIVSPGSSDAPKDWPAQMPLFEPITEPSARITKIAFFFARVVGPPDWPRYHFALFPGRYDTAVGLNTSPVTMTKLGRFGITRRSPALTSTSEPVFFH